MMQQAGVTGMKPDDYLRRVMGSYLDKATGPATTQHPDVLSQDEIRQLPPELIRQLIAHKYNQTALGGGAMAQLEQFRKRFEIRGDVTPEQFVDMYVLPALQ